MPARSRDLWAVAALAALGLAIQWAPAIGVVRAPAGLLLVVFCPGYALVAAGFPGRSLGWVERVTLSVGLSLALALLASILFNLTPAGLTTAAWAWSLFGLTTAGCLAAAWRRRKLAEPMAAPALWPLRRSQWQLFGLAALISVGALALVYLPLPSTNIAGYSMLWLVPDPNASTNAIDMGVSSSELTTVHYRVTLSVNGQVAQQWPNISLTPGQTWQHSVARPAQAGATLQANLYRLDQPDTVYRTVTLVTGP